MVSPGYVPDILSISDGGLSALRDYQGDGANARMPALDADAAVGEERLHPGDRAPQGLSVDGPAGVAPAVLASVPLDQG